FFNIHFSLLPAYRGTMTSFWPIVLRERSTGVTLHRIDDGIDTGDIIARRSFVIGEEDTCRDLYFRYHEAAAALLRDHLESVINGSFTATPQGNEGAGSFPRFLYPFFPKEFTSRQLRLMERGDVHNILRALIFREYQLPLVDGERIARIALADFPERNRTLPTNGGELYALAAGDQPDEA
ncbi:MAG: formyltransferase family protein, partial [Bacteroidota bacterium]